MRHSLLVALAAHLVIVLAAHAHAHAHARQDITAASDPAQAQPGQQQVDITKLPWPIRLGLRVEQVERTFPIIDRVVLVPDVATYIDEIMRWSPQGRWPVLIEDDELAPLFIRGFTPKEILRRPSVGELPTAKSLRESMLRAAIVRAWGGDPAKDEPREVFERSAYIPAGVVITSVDDPAWTAALALAAARGQPIAFLEGDLGTSSTWEKDPAKVTALLRAVESLVAEQGYNYRSLGDDLDAVTLCRELPGRVSLPGMVEQPDNPRAVTDALARNRDHRRWGFAGWIFGDETHAAYDAMCAIFLTRDDVLLTNMYPRDGDWERYALEPAADALRKQGCEITLHEGSAANIDQWRRRLMGGVDADAIFINSKGNCDFFDTFNGRAFPGDVPMLRTPAAMMFIHSWSAQFPADPSTVAGRWRQHGAYAYVGSAHEPFLGAFIPPVAVAERCANYIPLLIAARQWEGDHFVVKPWMVQTIGDPLMLCRANDPQRPARVDPAHAPLAAAPHEDAIDVQTHVAGLLRAAKDAPSDDAAKRDVTYGEAIRSLALLGKDVSAVDVWEVASSAGSASAPRASAAALGALFRMQNRAAFFNAYEASGRRDPAALDMLWHVAESELLSRPDERILLLLQSSLRRPRSDHDLLRLAPHLRAAFGEAHMRSVIQRELEAARNPSAKRALEEMMR